jgi:hypothetical protein
VNSGNAHGRSHAHAHTLLRQLLCLPSVSVAVSLHDPHVLTRSSLPAGIVDNVSVDSALSPDPSPVNSMAVDGGFHEASAAASAKRP